MHRLFYVRKKCNDWDRVTLPNNDDLPNNVGAIPCGCPLSLAGAPDPLRLPLALAVSKVRVQGLNPAPTVIILCSEQFIAHANQDF